MKRFTRSSLEKFRRGVTIAVACIVVFAVPVLSARQFIHPHVPHQQSVTHAKVVK